MNLPIYIGDEVSAQGYRLAGVEVHVVDDNTADLQGVILRAREQSPLVMINAGLTSRLPQQRLQDWLADLEAPLVIVPDVSGRSEMPDLGQALRRELGVWE